jgi:hypothetical protein
MKILLYILLIVAIGGGAYYYFYANSEETVEVRGSVHVSKNNSNYVSAAEGSGQQYFAVVQGVAKNKSKQTLKSVFIKYKIGGENTSTIIFDLGPGQQVDFVNKSVQIDAKDPDYFLDAIQFEKMSL